MKVQNMTSANGNKVANQFIISHDELHGDDGNVYVESFQSYDSIIATKRVFYKGGHEVTLDRTTWNYSKTTSKYRNQFLNETTKETQAKIDSGEYILADLN